MDSQHRYEENRSHRQTYEWNEPSKQNGETADEFGRRLLAACRGGTLPLRLDLSGVTELASAGVGALYHLVRQLADHGSRLELLVQEDGAVQAVLQLVGLPATLMPPATAGA